MKFDMKDLNDIRIMRNGRDWVDDFSILPPVAGVFIFVDDATEVKFVGIARDGKLRMAAEAAFKEGKGEGAKKLGWVRCFSETKAASLGADWIKKYAPPNNR
jgi:excinuclease UvrABC nuclease subunit